MFSLHFHFNFIEKKLDFAKKMKKMIAFYKQALLISSIEELKHFLKFHQNITNVLYI
jgi:hypothetical protein